ncbi:MAG: ABC transporter ATP-binding protein [Clostridia bacterium]|jgi:ATP-binding cassette subfamily B protein|nr:ABC transporter ATP-binding protein [Clostridia bacterium]
MNKENIKKEKKKGAIKRLLAYILKKNKGAMVVISIAILFSAIGSISSSVAIKYVVDSIVTPALSQGLGAVTGKLIGFALVMGGIYLVGIVSATVYTQVLNRVTQKVMDDLRCDVFAHMQSLPIKYFDTNNHGDIMSVYTNDIETVRQVISESLPQLLVSAVMIVMLLGVMLTYSVWLTAVVLCCIAVMTIAARIIGGKSGKHFGLQQKSVGELEGYIEEMLQGQKVVKVFCHEKKSKEGFDEKNDKLFGNSSKAHRYANIMMPVMGNIGNIMYVLVAFLGTILVVTQATNVTVTGINLLEVGVVASFLNMGRSFSMQVAMVSQEVNFIALAQAGSSRVFALLDEESETDEGYVTLVNAEIDENGNITETDRRTDIWAWKHPHGDGTLTYTRLNGDILLDDVDFCYEEGKPILRNIDVYAHAGEKVAFVGATGAGKTTITNLINRFYDIADGKIRYDGININKIKKADLRRSLGIVLQDTNLFTGTVMDNIRYGRLDATDEECKAAAALAGADSFITRLPEGYDTMLTGDGANLSQGQRQLLSIARAAVADAPVMILDEATSSIDTRTEQIVQQGTDRLMKGRTVFVIAHRLSTVRKSDVIMVLEKGRIIERGNHERLIEKKGQYYRLYTGAFELE